MQRIIERRKRLRAALAQEGLTVNAFVAALGVSRQHLYYVLTGERRSPRLEAAIQRVIAKHELRRSSAA